MKHLIYPSTDIDKVREAVEAYKAICVLKNIPNGIDKANAALALLDQGKEVTAEPKEEVCSFCNGTGKTEWRKNERVNKIFPCPKCNGTGKKEARNE